MQLSNYDVVELGASEQAEVNGGVLPLLIAASIAVSVAYVAWKVFP